MADTNETSIDLATYRESVRQEFEASLTAADIKRREVTDILTDGAVEAAKTLVKATSRADKWSDRIRASMYLLDHYLNTKEDDPVNDFLKQLASVNANSETATTDAQ